MRQSVVVDVTFSVGDDPPEPCSVTASDRGEEQQAAQGLERTPIAAMLQLQACEPDLFEGESANYPWGRLYGGQLVAQALRAAAATVPNGHRPHSAHAYFVQGGKNATRVRYTVERQRDGRSFSTRAVRAEQGHGVLLTMLASFQVAEPGFAVQTEAFPTVPPPEACQVRPWSTHFERRVPDVDARDGRATAWMRLNHALPDDDPFADACTLAFLSDDMAADAIGSMLPDYVPRGTLSPYMATSLAHTIWFHTPGHVDAWLLQDVRCHALIGPRGLAVGHIFNQDGQHLATLAQELLLRRRHNA